MMNATPPTSKFATTEWVFVFTAALLLATMAIGPGSAIGQSFDCRSAHAADEATICHEPALAKLDQELAALRRQRNEANRDSVEDNEIAFLNARRRCGENRGCIEQSYRNRIQELTRSGAEQGDEGRGRVNAKVAERQAHGRANEPGGTGQVPGRLASSNRNDPTEHTTPAETSRHLPNTIAAPAQPKILSSRSTSPLVRGWTARDASSRTAPKERQALGAHIRYELRDQVNSGLVTIIFGGLDSGDLTDATDLVATLHDPHLRVLPVAGEGAAKDVTDLLFARGIDIALVQTDVLASLKRQAPFPGVENYLQYICKLYDEEVHILAGRQIHSVEDLASKTVNFGPLDSGTFLTASAIFGALGVGVDIVTLPQPQALDKLRRGEIAALVYTAAKPARFFQAIRPDEGLHFLSIPAPDALRERYEQVTLSAADYPGLVEEDKPVSTLAVGTVLAVCNWAAGTERYRNVAHFVQTFFGRLAELRMSRHPPKWREVDIDAPVPGWNRFASASQWIKRAERDRVAGPQLPMEGSTTSPAQMLGAGWGDTGPSIAHPAINPPNSTSNDLDGGPSPARNTVNSQQPEAQVSNQASSNPRQLDALFREFLQYEKQELQKTRDGSSQNEALFAEFQAYVKQHLQ